MFIGATAPLKSLAISGKHYLINTGTYKVGMTILSYPMGAESKPFFTSFHYSHSLSILLLCQIVSGAIK